MAVGRPVNLDRLIRKDRLRRAVTSVNMIPATAGTLVLAWAGWIVAQLP
jgi:hypothetical protein